MQPAPVTEGYKLRGESSLFKISEKSRAGKRKNNYIDILKESLNKYIFMLHRPGHSNE